MWEQTLKAQSSTNCLSYKELHNSYKCPFIFQRWMFNFVVVHHYLVVKGMRQVKKQESTRCVIAVRWRVMSCYLDKGVFNMKVFDKGVINMKGLQQGSCQQQSCQQDWCRQEYHWQAFCQQETHRQQACWQRKLQLDLLMSMRLLSMMRKCVDQSPP